MENKPNLAKAIIAVMKAVKGIDKSMTVGTGSNSYKGVADKDVKQAIGEAMAENGLCMIPVDYESKFQIDRWEETTQYGKKMKQNIFTEVNAKYLLLHESGESQIISGLGHGVDSQDKSAGKATTYSMKNALLYTFLVPTGKIDDADNTHSDAIETPNAKTATQPQKEQPKQPEKWLSENTKKQWDWAVENLKKGVTIETIKAHFKIRPEDEVKLLAQAK